jgi:hypothetical protein
MWHEEVLSETMQGSLRELQKTSVLTPFYLAGGTGLALHLGHRRSLHLDFFSSKPFDEEGVVQRIHQLPGFGLVAKSPATLHARVCGTKVGFLSYTYPLLFPLANLMEIKVADPRDIACMKISAIASRGSKRDFVDLYVVSREFGFAQLLDLFKKKFAQTNYNLMHVLKSLTYFEDAEKEPIPDMLTPLSWEQVKRSCIEAVRGLA